jgi:hypothetical protein
MKKKYVSEAEENLLKSGNLHSSRGMGLKFKLHGAKYLFQMQIWH